MGLADGVFDVAREIMYVASARAPSGELPKGRLYHLHEMGGAIAWVDGKRVNESRTGDLRPGKPRQAKVRGRGILAIVGFGFPALFLEFGTVFAKAQAFFTPAVSEVLGADAPILLSKAMERRLGGQRSANTFKIRERIAASRARRAGG